jgi:hypothetical protein
MGNPNGGLKQILQFFEGRSDVLRRYLAFMPRTYGRLWSL